MASSLFKVSPAQPQPQPAPPPSPHELINFGNLKLEFVLFVAWATAQLKSLQHNPKGLSRGLGEGWHPGQKLVPCPCLLCVLCRWPISFMSCRLFFSSFLVLFIMPRLEWRMSFAGGGEQIATVSLCWGQVKGVARPSKHVNFQTNASQVCACVCVLWWRAEKPKIFIQFAKVARRVTHTPRLPASPRPRWLFAWLDALRHVSQRGWVGWSVEWATSRARRQVKHYNITRFPIHLWKSFSFLTSFFPAAAQREDFPFYYLQYPLEWPAG